MENSMVTSKNKEKKNKFSLFLLIAPAETESDIIPKLYYLLKIANYNTI